MGGQPGSALGEVAVGTALSGGPPHRSQCAELPHWAPRSGPTPVHSSTNRRTRSSTLDAPVPALCPEHVVLTAFPSRCPLPSTISAAAQRPCSTASPVLRGSPTSHDRASRACDLSLPRAARTVPGGRAIVIAVGTALTSGPPHRSQRAGLPHWAPASDPGVESHRGERMPYAGGWQPPFGKASHPVPVQPTPLASAA